MSKEKPAADDGDSEYFEDEVEPESALSDGADRILNRIEEHHATGPELVGADMDADWQSAGSVGDEAVGGHAPTPDQDEVDAIGRALGVEQDEDEEVRTHDEILDERDRERWELDRRSADEATEASG